MNDNDLETLLTDFKTLRAACDDLRAVCDRVIGSQQLCDAMALAERLRQENPKLAEENAGLRVENDRLKAERADEAKALLALKDHHRLFKEEVVARLDKSLNEIKARRRDGNLPAA
jgi:hypothetical protein